MRFKADCSIERSDWARRVDKHGEKGTCFDSGGSRVGFRVQIKMLWYPPTLSAEGLDREGVCAIEQIKKSWGINKNATCQQVLGRIALKNKYKDQHDRIRKIYRFKSWLDQFYMKNPSKSKDWVNNQVLSLRPIEQYGFKWFSGRAICACF